MIKPGMFISDRYEIIDKVGSGGMADVYKAKCHRLNRFVAIKILKPEYSDDKNFVMKFRAEAQSVAGLSHPNIVNVYDVGNDNNLHYIVMELVEGITLKNFIERKGKLEVKEAIGIAIQIALGMEAAHANHIIHRDIKPQNIIISKEGKVKVTDFGIAKATTSNTITSNAMGSVHYLSPEQARGGYSDEKSDIYSLGVTMYEMLSGRVPFAGDNTVSVALLHIQGEAASLREIDPNIPLSVDKIVQKCMQKKPERRYLSASELIADLKRSITNPNGDFVIIPAPIVTDSPTINISEDEMNHIKSVSKGAGLGINENEDTMQNTDGRRTRIDRQPVPVPVEEEEELDTVDPRMEKITLVGTIAVAVILVIIFIYISVKFFNLFPSKGNKGGQDPIESTLTPTPTEELEAEVGTVIVTSVVGLTFEDAEKNLKDQSDKLHVTRKEDYSDTYEAGFVMDQYPKKGAEIPADAEVQLFVSVGPESFKLTNVYGLSDQKATELLEKAGLIVEHDFTYNDEIEEGKVIETNPARDTPVVKGDTVTIIVSNGPKNEQSVVPDLLDLTEANALTKLKEAGLTLGNVSNDNSDVYRAGKVMYQNYEAGSKVASQTPIDITLSLGPKATTPTPGPQQYIGQITITDNPFDYPGESGIIVINMEQDGKTRNLFKGEKSYESFPITIPDIKSESGSTGTATMLVGRDAEPGEPGAVSENGRLIVYDDYDTIWAIVFTPVGQ
ncbi:MAG: Stk1 family PASTA domain-containing Ser/Thr kinase [Anaerocolumna aminovalerica]|jgi:serine/threonine protein kinase/beta-lactam-binding protein with PASTA domain|uniref:Stk1 family PASTA domain-containing Ser/Thr kinase n=2 Tax=Anaerocolumna aminovalerica TaxID=1527 RepID=UPI002907CCC5|nr:Stk1 family PASTA domain-containing Ser/Thr kinase [Anaerocolumna aminovalerica]MDU6264043.1 Stk1 family PASTA domain-containing Ser/Thr kinase [Anaerocolumna aminovalerica]